MPDDILKNAQKAIDNAAGGMQDSTASGASSPPPPQDAPVPQEPAPEPVTPPPATEPEKPQEPPKKEPEQSPDPTPAPAPPPAPEPAAPPEQPKPETPATTPDQTAQADQLVSSILEQKEPTTVVPPKGSPPPSGSMPKKKHGVSKVAVAVLALLLFALPVGVYFISQQNQQIADTRSSAWGTGYQECESTPGNPQGTCPSGQVCHCQDGNMCTETRCEPLPTTAIPCGNQGRAWCQNASGPGYTCCYAQYECCPSGEGCCYVGPGDDDDTPPTSTPITTINKCTYLKIFKDNVQVTPSTLLPGDQVVLAVKGGGSPAKARFRVNGSAWTESTTTNSNAEFTRAYTVPDGVTQFVIEAEVFVDGVWK